MGKLWRLLLAVGLIAALSLGAVACGDDDDDDDDSASEEITLTGEDTTLALDETLAGLLARNDVTVEPIAPATASDDGITFPITGGTINSESLVGTIEHSGGLRFSADGENVEVTDFVIDTSADTLTATADGEQLPLLGVNLGDIARSSDGDIILLEGITTTLVPEAAVVLNDAFGVVFFSEGVEVGDVTIRATAS